MPRPTLTLLLLCGAASSLWSADLQRTQEGDLDLVAIENEFLTVKLAANSGGRICSLVGKADGVEQVWWKGGRDAARSGLIDDKAGFEAVPYKATVEDEGSEHVVVRLEAPAGQEVNLTKTVTVVEGEPAIHVAYVYTNKGDKPLHTKHMVRNYYIHFEAAEPGQVASGRTRFQANAPSTHIVTVTTRNDKQTLNDFEIPVVIGHSTGGYLRGEREAEQSWPLVVLTDKDVERGYVVHWGQPKPPFEPAGPVELTMGADEYESLELGVLALRDMGNVTVEVSAPGWPEDAIEVRTQRGIAMSGAVLEDGRYALTEGNSLAMPLGAHKAFWFILNSHQVKPGRYSLTFTVHPEHGPVRALPAVVEVLDVRQASRDEVSLYFYQTLTYSGSRRHLEILRDHCLRQVEIHFGFRTWFHRVSVKRDERGALVVDFGGLDGALKLAREMGFDQVHITGGMWNDRWFAALSEEPPEQQLRTRHEFVRMLVDRLLELGFEEVVNYAIDEPSIAMATDPKFIERVQRLKQAAPRLKLHMTMNHYAPVIVEKLNPYMDRWTPNSNVLITLLEDTGKGTAPIDAADQVGFYGGAWYSSLVDGCRLHGWRAAYHGVRYYTLFAYSATRREWRLYDFDSDGNPETTPALEGMRDGFEDFAYWRQFELMLAQARELDAAKL